MTSKYNNKIFFALIVIIIIAVIIVQIKSTKQNAEFKEQNNRFQSSMQYIDKGNFEEANKLLSELSNEEPDSYQVIWAEAVTLSYLGMYEEADDKYTKVRELRPFIVKNQNYLLHTGMNYYSLEELTKAKKYFEECIKLNQDAEATKNAEKYLQMISEQSGEE